MNALSKKKTRNNQEKNNSQYIKFISGKLVMTVKEQIGKAEYSRGGGTKLIVTEVSSKESTPILQQSNLHLNMTFKFCMYA